MTEANPAVEEPSAVRNAPDTAGGPEGARRRAGARRWLTRNLQAWALPLLTVAVAGFFSVWPKTSDVFPTAANLQILLGTQTAIALVALGALIPLIANQWDLSVGATAGLAAVLVAQQMSAGAGIALALATGLAAGAAVGLLNAAIITRAGVNAVITTLGVATLVAGVVNQRTAGLAVVSNIPTAVTDFGTGTWLGLPYTVFAVIAIALLGDAGGAGLPRRPQQRTQPRRRSTVCRQLRQRHRADRGGRPRRLARPTTRLVSNIEYSVP